MSDNRKRERVVILEFAEDEYEQFLNVASNHFGDPAHVAARVIVVQAVKDILERNKVGGE